MSASNYKGQHHYRRSMPAWLQATSEAIGDGFTYVLRTPIPKLRIFIAALRDHLSVQTQSPCGGFVYESLRIDDREYVAPRRMPQVGFRYS